MSVKTELFPSNSVSSFSKFMKANLPSQKIQNSESKKMFTRKPSSALISNPRLIVNRSKTELIQNVIPQPNKLIQKVEIIKRSQRQPKKLLSNKNSQSLQFLKILNISSSMEDLTTMRQQHNFQQNSSNIIFKNKINSRNHHRNQNYNGNENNLIMTPKSMLNEQMRSSVQDSNHETSIIQTKWNAGSTQFSSNDNNQISQQFIEGQNHSNERFPQLNLQNSHNQCRFCSERLKKTLELERNYNKTVTELKQKSSEIKILNKKIIDLQKNLQKTKNLKLNLETEIQIIKENSQIIESQKEEIQKINHRLQSEIKKLTQNLKYKDLEVTISKIYKTKSLQMEFKVETLKRELEKSKLLKKKLEHSMSMQSLQGHFMKRDSSNMSLKIPLLQIGKKQKKPNLRKVYQEDTLFSLTSQSAIDP